MPLLSWDEIQTTRVARNEIWDPRDIHCPACGSQTVWRMSPADMDDYGDVFMAHHICLSCRSWFDLSKFTECTKTQSGQRRFDAIRDAASRMDQAKSAPEDVSPTEPYVNVVGFTEAIEAIARRRQSDAADMANAGVDPSQMTIAYEHTLANAMKVYARRLDTESRRMGGAQ